MKLKSIATAVLLFSITAFKDQDTIYQDIIKHIYLDYPEYPTSDKLLVLKPISADPSTEELEGLKELNRSLEVFKYARLKGGERGAIGVLLCNGSPSILRITLKRHGIHEPLLLFCSYEEWNKRFSSIPDTGYLLFDKNGKVLNSGLSSRDLFTTLHNRITR